MSGQPDPLVMPEDEFALVARVWRAWVDGPTREAFDRVIQEVAEDAAAPWRTRAEAAAAQLDAVYEYCQTYRADEGMTLACEDILAIIGTGEARDG